MSGAPFIFPPSASATVGDLAVNPNVSVTYVWDGDKWMWTTTQPPNPPVPGTESDWGSIVWGTNVWGTS